MSYRPRLRPHLHLEGAHLADWMQHRTYPLAGAAAALAPRLDGNAEWTELRASLIADGHADHDVDAALRRLYLLHAVEGAGDELSAKLVRVLHREEAVPTSILEGARFGCQGSGGCCQGYAFGPLADADVARLDQLDLAAAFPHLQPPYVETHPAGSYLRRDGDRCIFLAGDQRCGLHAAFGADAKPGFCRLYPLDSFATIEGIRVVDRGTCATFGVSARVGLPLVDDLARIRPLLDPPMLHHPLASVDGWSWDHGLFLRFTTAATSLVRRNRGTAGETLFAIGRLLDALTRAVTSCPLEPGQPDDVVTAVLARADEAWYQAPEADPAARGALTLATLLGELAAVAYAAVADGPARALATRLGQFAELATHGAATIDRLAPPVDPRPAPAASAPDVDVALRLSLRQQLFGRQVLVGGHAGAGLVRIGVIQLLALVGARRSAGPRALVAADLSHGHMLATRCLQAGALDRVLVDHEPRWRELLAEVRRATLPYASG